MPSAPCRRSTVGRRPAVADSNHSAVIERPPLTNESSRGSAETSPAKRLRARAAAAAPLFIRRLLKGRFETGVEARADKIGMKRPLFQAATVGDQRQFLVAPLASSAASASLRTCSERRRA